MKFQTIYTIRRIPNRNRNPKITLAGDVIALADGAPLMHVKFHSSGYEFGYMGGGPADLGLSIMANVFCEAPSAHMIQSGFCMCWRLHQQFKERFLGAKGDELTIFPDQVLKFLSEQAVPPDLLESFRSAWKRIGNNFAEQRIRDLIADILWTAAPEYFRPDYPTQQDYLDFLAVGSVYDIFQSLMPYIETL